VKKILVGLIAVLAASSSYAELCVINPTSSKYHVDTYIRNQSRCVTTKSAATSTALTKIVVATAVIAVITHLIENNAPEPECKTEWWFGTPTGRRVDKPFEKCTNKEIEDHNAKIHSLKDEQKLYKKEQELSYTITSEEDTLKLIECPRYKRWIANGDQATKDYWQSEFDKKCSSFQ
jgi:predicted metal-dependent phosphoesterase TrpH